ncbi:MAG: hypothetical protein AAF517_04645 [Planctomycetota bacterium]
MTRRIASLLILTLGVSSVKADDSPQKVFEERILPIFQSENPSSCVQCHLSSVDLKDYILPSHEKTFASLRAQGLVDLEKPERSKILTLIQMGEKDRDKQDRLIHESKRKAEYRAFSEWIKACTQDPRLRKLPAPKKLAKPKHEDALIRHARKSRVLDSFVRNIWSHRMRCFPCHTPHEINGDKPGHRRALERMERLEVELGNEHFQRIRLFSKTPEDTLKLWVERSRKTPKGEFPLLNAADPAHSLIVVKPTSKLPPKVDGERKPSNKPPFSHLGGLKMHVDDPSYKSFVAWIKDYGKVIAGGYSSASELPRDDWFPSKHVIVLQDMPEAWKKGQRMQLHLHSWNAAKNAWRDRPVAFLQNSVTPRHKLVGALTLIRSDKELSKNWKSNEGTLPPGKYLLRAYLDRSGRLRKDPGAFLTGDDEVGQTIVQGAWTKTFRNSRKIPWKRFEGPTLDRSARSTK